MAAANRKVSGRKPGNKTNLEEAQRKGAAANSARSTQKIRDLSDYIAKHPGIKKLSWSQRVAMLNSDHHYNLISATHNEKRPWTKGALRKAFKAALEESELQAAAKVSARDTAAVAILPPGATAPSESLAVGRWWAYHRSDRHPCPARDHAFHRPFQGP